MLLKLDLHKNYLREILRIAPNRSERLEKVSVTGEHVGEVFTEHFGDDVREITEGTVGNDHKYAYNQPIN